MGGFQEVKEGCVKRKGGRKKKRNNQEGFDDDKEGWVKRTKEGKRIVKIGKDLIRTKKDG